MKIKSDGFEGFSARARSVAKRIDAGERIEESVVLNFADPLDLLSVLTAQRIRLFQVIRSRKDISVSGLAAETKRDVKSVRRDVARLEDCGIVRTELRSNPGHGHVRVVLPVARKIALQATL